MEFIKVNKYMYNILDNDGDYLCALYYQSTVYKTWYISHIPSNSQIPVEKFNQILEFVEGL